MVTHTCNPGTWEAKAGGLQVQGQSGLHRKILSQNKTKPKPATTKSLQKSLGMEMRQNVIRKL
jgi:hypothetical protein